MILPTVITTPVLTTPEIQGPSSGPVGLDYALALSPYTFDLGAVSLDATNLALRFNLGSRDSVSAQYPTKISSLVSAPDPTKSLLSFYVANAQPTATTENLRQTLGMQIDGNGDLYWPQHTGYPYANASGKVTWSTNVGCSKTLVAALTTTAAATDTVTVAGMTSTGYCSLTATNASAATNIATTYISAKTTNQITVTHATIASMTYDVMCTAF
jgi:hypothetical protein